MEADRHCKLTFLVLFLVVVLAPATHVQEQSLTRCDRALLGKLRELNKEVFQQKLMKYLSPEQLDALEFRRALLVKHFHEQIARKGEGAVLYDLPPRR